MFHKKTLAALSGCALMLCSLGVAAQQTVTRKWELVVDGAAHSTDTWSGLSTDGFGNSHMTGNTRFAERSYYYDGIEARTVKVDRFGAVAWSAAHAGAGVLGAEGMGLDNDVRGNVLVAANDYLALLANGSMSMQSAVIKYDASGLVQWVRNYAGFWTKAIKVNAAGASYVAGLLQSAGVTQCMVAKYSAAGVLEWTKVLPGTPYDSTAIPVAVAVTRDGGAAVSCGTRISGGVAGQQVAVYGATGALVWQGRHEVAGVQSTTRQLLLDDNGNLVVLGQANFGDFLLTKWSPTGAKLWAATYDGGQSRSDEPNDMALDNAGNVYVTGSVNGSGVLFGQTATLKFAGANGSLQWASAYGTGIYNAGKGLRVDGSGNVLVLAMNSTSQVLLKYNAAGGLSWADIVPAGTRQVVAGAGMTVGIAIDATGCFVISGATTSPQVGAYANNDLVLIKYCLGAQSCF